MAEFIIGSPLRKLAREHEFLRQVLWRLDYGLLWLLEKCLTVLPVDLASRIGAAIGGLVGPLMQSKSAIFRNNFAVAFPELSDRELDRLVRRAWSRAGRILAEFPHMSSLLEGRVDIEIRAPIATYEDPGKPCVVVTAHQSNWEMVGAAMAELNIPNASLYTPPTNPMLDKLLLESRRVLNCQLLPRDNSARRLMRVLREGRTAAMVMDRRVDEGRPIRFFGQDKLSTLLPAKLALKFDCPMVPVQIVRTEGAHFRAIFHEPITPRCPDGDETEQAIDMIQQVHEQFEDWIRAKPEDWFCSKRLWPKGKIESTEGGAVARGDNDAS